MDEIVPSRFNNPLTKLVDMSNFLPISSNIIVCCIDTLKAATGELETSRQLHVVGNRVRKKTPPHPKENADNMHSI